MNHMSELAQNRLVTTININAWGSLTKEFSNWETKLNSELYTMA
jgi:hypothetical protein